MKKKTEGAWIISHMQKLQLVTDTSEFETIEIAGKCGIILSSLCASDEQSDIDEQRVFALARASKIKTPEVRDYLNRLKDAKLIDIAKNGSVSVLGVTTSHLLSHVSDIFNDSNPTASQKAALFLSDKVSDFPERVELLREEVADTYQLSKVQADELLMNVETIGFVDSESRGKDEKIYFNGNLFKSGDVQKIASIISSLNPEEVRRLQEFDAKLLSLGCVPEVDALKILGMTLIEKVKAIGMYDFIMLSNKIDNMAFVTKPRAFSKFGNPFEEDALDLAKAFVASLCYGMNFSGKERGQIIYLKALLVKLIRGEEVGPAPAIGEDYKLLEFKNVLKLRKASEHSNRYYMRLLKKDIGELALNVLINGDASEQVIIDNVRKMGNIANFSGPELNRTIARKSPNSISDSTVHELLSTLRR